MWAARHGHLSMVETLLANGLNLLQVGSAVHCTIGQITMYDRTPSSLWIMGIAISQISQCFPLS